MRLTGSIGVGRDDQHRSQGDRAFARVARCRDWAYLNMCMFVLPDLGAANREPGPAPPVHTVDVSSRCSPSRSRSVRRTRLAHGRSATRTARTFWTTESAIIVRAMTRNLASGISGGRQRERQGRQSELCDQVPSRAVHSPTRRGSRAVPTHRRSHARLLSTIRRWLSYSRPQDFYNVDSFSHVVNDEVAGCGRRTGSSIR